MSPEFLLESASSHDILLLSLLGSATQHDGQNTSFLSEFRLITRIEIYSTLEYTGTYTFDFGLVAMRLPN